MARYHSIDLAGDFRHRGHRSRSVRPENDQASRIGLGVVPVGTPGKYCTAASRKWKPAPGRSAKRWFLTALFSNPTRPIVLRVQYVSALVKLGDGNLDPYLRHE